MRKFFVALMLLLTLSMLVAGTAFAELNEPPPTTGQVTIGG